MKRFQAGQERFIRSGLTTTKKANKSLKAAGEPAP